MNLDSSQPTKIFIEKCKTKRSDLQGIRGIAIISVLGFHFLPSIFPNGYAGVDQFFVLSGFLMCMLLQKSYVSKKHFNFLSIFQWIFNFYIRRLKRILPLYFLIILLSLLAVFTIFPYTAIDPNVISGREALIFQSNRATTDADDYFLMLSIAIDVFTHTWSLSVEVQFYMIVPFLYLFGAIIQCFSKKLNIFYYVFLGASSFLYSVIFLWETAAFHSVIARIWQFSVGMIIYLLTDTNPLEITQNFRKTLENSEQTTLLAEEEESGVRKISSSTKFKYLLTIVILLVSLFPLELPAQILRPFITISTGILMFSPSENEDKLLESSFLTYFGDISYSLYLIHWPIYAYWKFDLSDENLWNFQLFLAFGLSVLLAVLSYEFFEKWYLKLSNKNIFILSTIFFSLNIGILYQEDFRTWISPPEFSKRLDGLKDGEIVSYNEAEKLNRLWSAKDVRNMNAPTCVYEKGNGPFGFCRHKGLDTINGKYKLMLIGNSIAANHARIFYAECGFKANSIVQESFGTCEPLYPFTSNLQSCADAGDVFEKKVSAEKPDYLFIFSRFFNIGYEMASNITKLDDDPIYKLMKNRLETYLKYVKYKIFMMNQVASVHPDKVDQIVKNVMERKNLTEFDRYLVRDDPRMARLRYEKLVSECSRCQLFDYKPLFFNETTQNWRYYDERNSGLSYFTRGNHFSFHGLDLIRPVISNICRDL